MLDKPELTRKYIQYYLKEISNREKNLCMITGDNEYGTKKHTKGVVSLHGNAKLISANDKTDFTYLGRFLNDEETVTIGYIASQKIHNAMRWIIANQGVLLGGRCFVAWNPEGKKIPNPTGVMAGSSSKTRQYEMSDYKYQLQSIITGWKSGLTIGSEAIVAVFDAATNGRLSLTYYNEIQAQEFVERLGFWDTSCCWLNRQFGIQSPSIIEIAQFAVGTLRNGTIESDERILKKTILRLIICKIEKKKLPVDIEKQLVAKCSSLKLYTDGEKGKWLRSKLLFITCSVIKKYHFDHMKEDWKMSLEAEKKDRSYQYGRLLAVMEKAESDTYDTDDNRETNAIRMQSVFVQKPQYAARIIIEQLKRGYYRRLTLSQRTFYEKTIGQIMEQISEYGNDINLPLKDTYLLGYYLQKNELYKSKKTKIKESESEVER